MKRPSIIAHTRVRLQNRRPGIRWGSFEEPKPMSEPNELRTEISSFCRQHGLAESTFGRLAVNDGKFVSRLRDGGRVRSHTLSRVKAFLASPPSSVDRTLVIGPRNGSRHGEVVQGAPGAAAAALARAARAP